MLEAEAFQAQGLLYCRREFFSLAECLRLQQSMREASRSPSTTYYAASGNIVDPQIRSTLEAELGHQWRDELAGRLRGFRHELEAYFGVAIKGMEPSQFLCYRPGDYFRPHRDESRSRVGDTRLISVVIFVNAPEAMAELSGYSGGELVFYRPSRRPPYSQVGMPLKAAPGLMIAFRPDLLHGVQPVSAGERHSIASWLI